MRNKTTLQILVWGPVLLLPLANLISAGFVPAVDYDLTQTAVWVIGAVAEELFYRFFLLQELLLKRTQLRPRVSIMLVSLLQQCICSICVPEWQLPWCSYRQSVHFVFLYGPGQLSGNRIL